MIREIIYAIIALNILAGLIRITQIGKYREPVTTGEAVGGVVITGLYVWLWIYILGVI